MKTGRSQVANRESRTTPSNRRLPVSRFTLLAILLLAALLRFYRLDAQSFWNDEGNSARIAERTLNLIVEGAAGDIHPPGYYLLLHTWRAVFGQSEFVLRALSTVAGLLLVVLTYRLGRRLFGEATGLMAAFLGALSPFAVYYSQEARMYALLGMLSAASTYLFLRALDPWPLVSNERAGEPANRRAVASAVAYMFTAAVGLYTQYAFALVLLVHNAIFAVWWLAVVRRSVARWRWLATWVGAQAGIVVLYLPWLPTALRSVTGWPSAEQAYALGPALLNVLRWLAVGHTLPLEDAWAVLIGAGVLLCVGLWPRKGRWFGAVSLALYLLLPIALILAFDLYKEAWLKFLIVVLPPFHILVARGMENLAQVASGQWQKVSILHPASYILLIGLSAMAVFPSLHNLYFDSVYARDDYRQIASDIAAKIAGVAPPGGAIILNAPNQWEVFTYYYPDQNVYPAPYRPGPERVETFLYPLVKQYDCLFALYWGDAESDPQRLVEAWLAAHAYKADDRWYGRVRLSTYGVAGLPKEPAVALDARFGENIRLRGYALAGEQGELGMLPVTFFWEAQAPTAEPYKVTVQLLDGTGQLVAQHDGEPAGGFAPTTAWGPGQVIVDRHGILLPAALVPGRYALAVAVYHAYTGERLPVTLDGESVGDHLPLGNVEIAP